MAELKRDERAASAGTTIANGGGALYFLILGTVAYTLFAITVRASQRASCNILAVGVINYVVGAAAYCVLLPAWQLPDAEIFTLGVATGIIFAIGFVVLSQSLRRRGLSVTTGVVQLAVLFPVLVGISLYAERPNALQAAGVGSALIALPLLAATCSPLRGVAGGGRAPWLTILQLLIAGSAMVLLQSFNHVASPADRTAFFAVLFVTAVVVSTAAWAVFERRLRPRDLAYGVILGIWNATHGFMLVSAMKTIPGMVVWPAVSASSLMLSTLVGVKLWGEHLSRTGKIGMVLALVAVICINVGRG